MISIGIYPGTFDPIHDGHVAFAVKALNVLQLKSVVFIPESCPRKKSPTSLDLRMERIGERIAHESGLSIRQLHALRFTPLNTIDELVRLYPNAELSLLLGSDVALRLQEWQNLEYLFATFKLVIGIRGNVEEGEIVEYIDTMKQMGHDIRYVIVHAPFASVSSSSIRANSS